MRNIRFKNIIVALVIAAQVLGLASCTKDFEDINKNPNNAEPGPGPLFGGVLVGTTGHRYEMARGNLLTTMVLGMQGYSTNSGWGTALNLDDNALNFAGEYWARTYERLIGGISATNNAIDNSEFIDDAEKDRMRAVVNIWRVMLMHRLTDMFGDIPYSEAGLALSGNFSPAYDSQQDIYNDMFVQLANAASTLSSATGTSAFGTSDMVYQGDYNKWYRLANSLRLRLALRISNVDPGKAQTEAAAALQGDLIDDNSQSCQVIHTYDGTAVDTDDAQWSPTANGTNAYIAIGWHTVHASSAMINLMKFRSNTADGQLYPEHDPRIPAYFRPVDGSNPATYVGAVLGEDHFANVVATTSDLNGDAYFSLGQDALMLGADEVAFLKAEAVLKGWASGNAKDLYTDGVTKSLEYIGVLNNATPEFWTALSNAYDAASDKLEPVVTQRWIALMSNGFEAWSLIRRTGYPNFVAGQDIAAGKAPANRTVYPNSEYNTNNANVTAAAGSIGGDKSTISVWWDN